MTIAETIARGIAVAKGIEICADASYEHSSFGALAKAAITALTEAGYAIVPIDPTSAMQEAGVRAKDEEPELANAQVYRAMISAAHRIDTKEGK